LRIANSCDAATFDELWRLAAARRIEERMPEIEHRTSVVLRGSYSCGPFASGLADRGVIDLTVEQARRDRKLAAFGFLEPSVCDGTSQPFAVTLTGTGAQRLRAGAATWAGSGYVEGDTGLQHVQVAPTRIMPSR
jgi:hypothetical protein